MSNCKFFLHFFHPKHRKNLSTPVPSSHSLAKEITSKVTTSKTPKTILEVGPGTGIYTQYLVDRLQPDDKLDVVEITSAFAENLNNVYKDYSNVEIYNISITDFSAPTQYDYIISSLPLNIFKPDMVEQILNQYTNWVKEGGRISYMEYAGGGLFRDKKITEIIASFQKNFITTKKLVIKNYFPSIVWHLIKK